MKSCRGQNKSDEGAKKKRLIRRGQEIDFTSASAFENKKKVGRKAEGALFLSFLFYNVTVHILWLFPHCLWPHTIYIFPLCWTQGTACTTDGSKVRLSLNDQDDILTHLCA
jgi:hypothetical protein